jgi:hypothetical protein
VISAEEYETALDEIRLLVGRLKGLIDEVSDDLERSTIELQRKRFELQVAEARQAASAAIVNRNTRLNVRKKGMVSAEDVAVAEAEDHANISQISIKGNEVQEIELKLKQLQKHREMLSKSLEKTDGLVRLGAQDNPRDPATANEAN